MDRDVEEVDQTNIFAQSALDAAEEFDYIDIIRIICKLKKNFVEDVRLLRPFLVQSEDGSIIRTEVDDARSWYLLKVDGKMQNN